jgi:hypothetical protein
MAKVRCKETTADSLFCNFLYDQKVDQDHFMRNFREAVDWERFTKQLLKCYQGKGEIGAATTPPPVASLVSGFYE